MAAKNAKTVTRKPKSLAHVLRLLSGLLPHVDPVTGVFYQGQPKIKLDAVELSPILRRRFRDSGVVIVEDIDENTATLRLACKSDARQFELFDSVPQTCEEILEKLRDKNFGDPNKKEPTLPPQTVRPIWIAPVDPPATYGPLPPIMCGSVPKDTGDTQVFVRPTQVSSSPELCQPSLFSQDQNVPGAVKPPGTDETQYICRPSIFDGQVAAADDSVRVADLGALAGSVLPTPYGDQIAAPSRDQ